MSYQVNITRKSARNQAKFWFIGSSAALIFLLNTAGSVFNIAPEISGTASLAITLGSAAAILAIIFRKRDVFIKIEDHQIEYFDLRENRLIAICVSDIVNVSTRFGELHLTTANQTYCIDMTVIRDEKTRWEIKETIKAMAPAEFRSLNMAG